MNKTKQNLVYDKEFFAMLVHDIRTPIKAQVRAANLLYSGLFGEFPPEVKNLLLNIIASNKYLQCLVDNILNDYIMQEGKLVISKTKNDFRKTLENSLCNIGILSEAKGQKIAVKYNTGSFVREYDETEIQRVVVNLLSNAFEYGEENSVIEVSVSCDNENIRFEVMSKLSKYICEAESCLHASKSGYGLGLLICAQIISLHNGKFYKNEMQDGFYKAGFIIP